MTVRSLSEDELASTCVAKSLEYLKRLSMLTIVPEQHEEDDLESVQNALFKSNLNMLCALLCPKVSVEKDENSSQEEDILAEPNCFVPLYAGSKVSLHDSKIRQLVTRQQLAEALKGMTYGFIDAGHAPKDVGVFVQRMLEKELERANNVRIETIKEYSLNQAVVDGGQAMKKLRAAEDRCARMADELRTADKQHRLMWLALLLANLFVTYQFVLKGWEIFGDLVQVQNRYWWLLR